MPLKPHASARCTRLAAISRSGGVYSWKYAGVSPSSAARSSIGSDVSVPTKKGTPVRTEARTQAMSPCPSWATTPMTPMGAMKIGDGKRIPNNSTDMSRCSGAIPMRGYRPHRLKASQLARWVCSSPAPPATYPSTFGVIAADAFASNSSNLMGYWGWWPCSDWSYNSFW